MNYIQIGNRIRNFRRQKGFTQEALAEASDLSPSYLSHIERGAKHPSLTALTQLSAALDIPLEQLLFDTLPDKPDEIMREMRELLDASSPQERCFLCDTIKVMRESLRNNHIIV